MARTRAEQKAIRELAEREFRAKLPLPHESLSHPANRQAVRQARLEIERKWANTIMKQDD